MNFLSFFKKQSFDKYAFYVICATIFLVPISFIPYGWFSVPATKSLLILSGATISFILVLIESIKTKTSIFSHKIILIPFIFLSLSYILSALFSISLKDSLFGSGFENDTASFVSSLCLFSLLFFTSAIKTKRDVQVVVATLSLSFLTLFFYEALRIFGRLPILSFNGLEGPILSIAGSLSDIGIIAGVFVVILALSLDFMSFNLPQKFVVGIFSIICVAFVVLSNLLFNIFIFSFSIHILTALFALVSIYFYYQFFLKRGHIVSKSKAPFFSIALVIISLFFAVFGNISSQKLSLYTNAIFTEIRPSWLGTFTVVSDNIKNNPILGSGPGTFEFGWSKLKIKEFNETPLWNADFNFGVSTVATSLGSVGIMGFLAWMIMIILAIKLSFSLFKKSLNPDGKGIDPFINFSVSSGLFYLSIILLLYSPGIVLMFLFFILISIAYIYNKEKEIFSKIHSSKFKNILNIIFCLIFILALIAWQFIIVKKAVGALYVGNAIRANSPHEATGLLMKAIEFENEPSYHRLIAQSSLLELQEIVNLYSVSDKKITDDDQRKIAEILGNVLRANSLYQQSDPSNYRTFLSSGSIYESLAFYGLPDVYDLALSGYQKASELSPTHPLPYLLSARVEASRQDYNSAKEYLKTALELKTNYSDAFVLLSDIAVAEGDMIDAEIYMEKALETSPDSASLHFALGRFKYNNENYLEAEKLFADSFKIDPSFSSARLAKILSIYSSGRKSDAIEEMTLLVSDNPSNEQAKEFLEKMKDGTLLKIETEVLDKKSTNETP